MNNFTHSTVNGTQRTLRTKTSQAAVGPKWSYLCGSLCISAFSAL